MTLKNYLKIFYLKIQAAPAVLVLAGSAFVVVLALVAGVDGFACWCAAGAFT